MSTGVKECILLKLRGVPLMPASFPSKTSHSFYFFVLLLLFFRDFTHPGKSGIYLSRFPVCSPVWRKEESVDGFCKLRKNRFSGVTGQLTGVRCCFPPNVASILYLCLRFDKGMFCHLVVLYIIQKSPTISHFICPALDPPVSQWVTEHCLE